VKVSRIEGKRMKKYKWTELGKLQTSGGDDRLDICMFRESFHALFFSHVEDQALLYKVLHL
jgi:hypothetical protein